MADDVSSATSVMPATLTATPTTTKGLGGIISSAIASVTSEAGSRKSSSAAVAVSVDFRWGSFAGIAGGIFTAFF